MVHEAFGTDAEAHDPDTVGVLGPEEEGLTIWLDME